MIPALHRAEFLRFGSIHRNTYIDAPARLGPALELRDRPNVRFAGLLTGVEGYIESCAMGLVVAWLLAGELAGRPVPPPPPTTMFGGLYHHVTAPREGDVQVRADERQLRPAAAAARHAQGQPQAADGGARARRFRRVAGRGGCPPRGAC